MFLGSQPFLQLQDVSASSVSITPMPSPALSTHTLPNPLLYKNPCGAPERLSLLVLVMLDPRAASLLQVQHLAAGDFHLLACYALVCI